MTSFPTRLLLFLALSVGYLQADELKLPPEAVALLPETPLVPAKPASENVGIERVETVGAAQVWRLTSPGKLEKPHELAVSKNFTQPIATGQVCLFVIKARCVESAAKDGKGHVTAAVQNRENYSVPLLWKPVVIGREWETTYFAFQAASDAPEGQGHAKLATGGERQIIEVADLQLYRFPVGFDIFSAPRMAATYEGRELNAPWRAEAEARIAKLRQGAMAIRVVDASGVPVTGAKIHVEMKRHAFGFGSAVDPLMLSALDPKLAPADQVKYRAVVDELFSRIVCENGLRVDNIEGDDDPARPWAPESRRRTKAAVLWTLQWAADHKMTSRGHYLVWCYLEQWARDLVKAHGPDGLLARYDRHFASVIPLADDYVTEWDALNHPVPFAPEDALYRVIGPDIYADLYKKIRPLTHKLLFVNEDTSNADRTDGLEKNLRHMIECGATPDGCGFQSHYLDYDIPSMDDTWKTWNRFAPLVRHLTITEYDFQSLDDQLHADHLRDMLTLAFSHPQMTGFMIWGFWEKRHWKPTAAMFKTDWTERPAVKVWRDLVKGKWWTRADLTSDARGEAATPAYYGWYEVSVEYGGKKAMLVAQHLVDGSKVTVRMP